MCRKVSCKRCGRPTWAGCGAHVEQVLRDVPTDQRCHCRDAAAKQVSPQPRQSWLQRLRSR